uniref:Uncharacterized protein n=1 Tax=Ciona savignyi TaxID=51511 RepID=H2ZNM6_CIOSA
MREQISNPREQVVNLCLNRKTTIDIALFVVLFTWMGITMAYVLNFILWNNREVASHKSYIKTLEQSKQTIPKRQNTKPLDDSTSPPAAKPN